MHLQFSWGLRTASRLLWVASLRRVSELLRTPWLTSWSSKVQLVLTSHLSASHNLCQPNCWQFLHFFLTILTILIVEYARPPPSSSWFFFGFSDEEILKLLIMCVGYTAWAPEGHKVRSTKSGTGQHSQLLQCLKGNCVVHILLW